MKRAILLLLLATGCGATYGSGTAACVADNAAVGCVGKYAKDVQDTQADEGSSAVPDIGGPSDPVGKVCWRWNNDRKDLSEGSWSGNVKTCDAGDVSATGRANALRQVNLVRYLAGLPAVSDDATLNAKSQACAMITWANASLSHQPPESWKCWTQDAYDAAGHANLFSGPAVAAVLSFMVDSGAGNADSLGHRRWLLSNSLGPIGIGSTAKGPSCMWVIGGSGAAGKAWTAWPPPGVFPLAARADNYGDKLESSGWTIQSDSLNLGKATVTVTENGSDMPVLSRSLAADYGSNYAIAFVPQGWSMAAGKTYHVVAAGVGVDIAYDVQVVDCAGVK